MNLACKLIDNVEKVIVGKRDVIELAVLALLCKGHFLIEDVPGTGKTILVRALAQSLAINSKRLQCTPDLLPSDITGVPIFNQKTAEFEFRPGPVFTNILLTDEINRATPRAQSALLECMSEHQVSSDGKTYHLPPIFMVIATQNPIDMIGTHVLPEAQLDRFFMQLKIGYPTQEEEVSILQSQSDRHPLENLGAITTENEVNAACSEVKKVFLDTDVATYLVQIVAATRQHADIRLGASPRGTLALARGSQGLAYIRGQSFVTPDLVKELIKPILAHRLLLYPQASSNGATAQNILDEITNSIPVPV